MAISKGRLAHGNLYGRHQRGGLLGNAHPLKGCNARKKLASSVLQGGTGGSYTEILLPKKKMGSNGVK